MFIYAWYSSFLAVFHIYVVVKMAKRVINSHSLATMRLGEEEEEERKENRSIEIESHLIPLFNCKSPIITTVVQFAIDDHGKERDLSLEYRTFDGVYKRKLACYDDDKCLVCESFIGYPWKRVILSSHSYSLCSHCFRSEMTRYHSQKMSYFPTLDDNDERVNTHLNEIYVRLCLREVFIRDYIDESRQYEFNHCINKFLPYFNAIPSLPIPTSVVFDRYPIEMVWKYPTCRMDLEIEKDNATIVHVTDFGWNTTDEVNSIKEGFEIVDKAVRMYIGHE
jgi:hypothetical protein